MTDDPINIITGLFWLLTVLVVSITILFINANNKSSNLKLLKYKLKKY